MTKRKLNPEDDPDKPSPHNGTTTSKLDTDTMTPFATSQKIRVPQHSV